MLAEASATKENRHSQSNDVSGAGKTIFASGDEDGASGELSHIIKSDDSPDTLSVQDSRLGDVSFSALADLSMLRASRTGTPFNKSMMDNSTLSPIAAKSPDLSMTPYLNYLTLDASMSGGGSNPPSAVKLAVMSNLGMSSGALNGRPTPGSVQSSSGRRSSQSHSAQQGDRTALDSSATMNRSLFGTSTKRKRNAGTEDSDGDATRTYGQEEGEQVSSAGLSQSQLGRTRSSSSRTNQRLWAAEADDSMLSAANDSSYQHNVTSLAGAHGIK